jgi:undecaprenyl-phosphate galactose phosphotransferase
LQNYDSFDKLLADEPCDEKQFGLTTKRCFDLLASVAGLAAISPLLLLIAAIVYINDPGPVIFAHRRVGRSGKMFDCYKFRTMAINSQALLDEYLAEHPAAQKEWLKDFKLKEDPRIIGVGNFLRKTSLDELPQLLNVVKGEMSLVGPRPIVKEEIGKYGAHIAEYCSLRPGITGCWQISGRNNVKYEERVRLDAWYARNRSFRLDMIILLKTVKVVLSGKGAY